MTPQEKAKELVDRFFNPDVELRLTKHERTQCALICIDEIEYLAEENEDTWFYWQEVKQEINAM